MVCVPCIVVPVLLYIWHKFLQPLLLRYWNPWAKKDNDGYLIQTDPKSLFDCKGGVCAWKGTKTYENGQQIENNPCTVKNAATQVKQLTESKNTTSQHF